MVHCSLIINDERINSVWFWRDEQFQTKISENKELQDALGSQISGYLQDELNGLRQFFFNDQFNRDFKFFSNSSFMTINKLEVLARAQKAGLSVPNYIITNSKHQLLKFKEKYKRIITKSIHENISVNTHYGFYFQYTEEIKHDLLEKLPSVFFPSLFQELIEKELEIRVLYLDSRFYSMAIFSQEDQQTEVDYRRYNTEKWNRNVPYKLPAFIEKKLSKLMKVLNLNTGSIDLIKDQTGNYIFLEVNPNGQFGMVSKPCNYHLEKKVAEYLCNFKEPLDLNAAQQTFTQSLK